MGIFDARNKQPAHGQQERFFRPAAFYNLTDKELSLVYSAAKIKKYGPDALLIRQGDSSRSFFIILEGRVTIAKDFGDFRKEIDFHTKGSLIGELAFVRGIPRVADAVTAEPSTVMEITEASFETLPVKTQLVIYKNIASLAANRLENLILKSVDIHDEKERLYKYIRYNFRKKGIVQSTSLIKDLIPKIPKLPVYASKLISRLMDESTTPQEVTESIKADPSLAAMILKTVNSPYFGFVQKVSDLNRAVVLLGFNGVYQMVVNNGLKSTMPQSEPFTTLQTHSLMVSMIANEVSLLSSRERAGVNSTIGLLHDLGKSVILLLKLKNPKIGGLLDTVDHSEIGSELLRSWSLPDHMCEVIERQNYPEFSPPQKIDADYLEDLGVLYISKICCEHIMGNGQTASSTAFFNDYLSVLKFPRQSSVDFCKEKIYPVMMKNEGRFPANLRYELRNKEW